MEEERHLYSRERLGFITLWRCMHQTIILSFIHMTHPFPVGVHSKLQACDVLTLCTALVRPVPTLGSQLLFLIVE